MKPVNKARRALLATLIASASVASTGCSTGSGFTLASLNPFAKSPAPTAGPGSTDSPVTKFASSTKSAFSKTTQAVSGVFKSPQPDNAGDVNDPLSLAHKPEKVGPEVYVANGQLWESTGDLKKAMESYTRALESEANNPQALTNIARLHFRQGNHEMAAEFFRRAIEQNPKDAGLQNDLGLTLSKMGDYAGASQALGRALTIAPGTSRYANNLASVKFENGDSASAFQVLAANNKPAVAHFNMAYLHFKNGQMTDARRHLSQALQSEPQAETDVSIKRAVDRSREMLAQIDASMAPVAQAAPHATTAGGRYFNAPSASVQQTSKVGGPYSPAVSPAAGPAMSTIAPPTVVEPSKPAAAPTSPAPMIPAPTAAAPAATAPAPNAAAPSAAAQPAPAHVWGTSPAASGSNGPKPIKPTEASDSQSQAKPSVPFALPGSFNP